MQLKECMEDTADNKVWGDWMLINLCVLHSVQYFCISSSLLSCSWLSRPPLKGMTEAPGSWLSTHSLIFTNLVKSAATKLVRGLDWTWEYLLSAAACIFMTEAEGTYECLQEITLWRWPFLSQSLTLFPLKFSTKNSTLNSTCIRA